MTVAGRTILFVLLALPVASCGGGASGGTAGGRAADTASRPPAAAPPESARRLARPDSATARGALPSDTVAVASRALVEIELSNADTTALTADLVLTDPAGRRAGADSRAGTRWEESPGARYREEREDVENDSGSTTPMLVGKTIVVQPPLDGTYLLDITGTGAETYDLSVRGHDRASRAMGGLARRFVSLRAGETHRYRLRYRAAAPESLVVEPR